MKTKLKQENPRLKVLKGMLEYHKENSGKKMLLAKLEREINFIETQEAAKERELKLSLKSYLETTKVKTGNKKNAHYKVVTKGKKDIFYGNLKECSRLLVVNKGAELVIKRNTP